MVGSLQPPALVVIFWYGCCLIRAVGFLAPDGVDGIFLVIMLPLALVRASLL
jgi:hypothetical protein